MPKFAINEYVWDRTREGPGIVVGYDERLALPYTVAEITEQRRLSRIGYRSDDSICRYVRLILPEDEVQRLLRLSGDEESQSPRLREGLEKRGIEPEY